MELEKIVDTIGMLGFLGMIITLGVSENPALHLQYTAKGLIVYGLIRGLVVPAINNRINRNN
jgi:hypothetical protein